ncbi:hypothetical protein ABH944_002988 [Caballeronia udeis]|uniref:Uncharacterized protein n=1 Tax=Caballeronia udeis TaxID=1232866 RepID=A0ABW8MGS1_9BURK
MPAKTASASSAIKELTMTPYVETREQLLRRAAAGENVTKDIYALDAAQVTADKEQALAAQVARAAANIASEEAQKQLQKAHDDAVIVFKDLQAKAGDAAAHVESLFAQTRAALDAWQQAQGAAQAQSMTVHHFAQQGAKRVMMPVAFSGADYSVHLLRHAGTQFHQQILYTGLLPRIV